MFSFLNIKSLGSRIIAINLIGLIFLAIGFILVDKSENNLIEARKEALILQANLIAFSFTLSSDVSSQDNNIDNLFLTRNWSSTKIARTQIFNDNLIKIFDSRDFQKKEDEKGESQKIFFSNYIKKIVEFFDRDAPLLPEVGYSSSDLRDAIQGKTKASEYKLRNGGITVHVSIPLERNNSKREVLLLSTQEGDIGRILQEERQRYLRAFIIALSISLFLSISLSSTIARPLNRLARATEGVSNACIG